MDWREKHGQIITDFLYYMNNITSRYVLKGGTALKMCYKLDRFSEDIDLDGTNGNQIITICQKFSKKYGYSMRVAKNTDTVKRCMINYNGIKPMKVELSARKKEILEDETVVIDGIRTYTIDIMTELKVSAYQQRDKIRDLYDIAFLINNYYDELEKATKRILRTALEYKGIEHLDYIISTQKDELINQNSLEDAFLKAYEKVGLLTTAEEQKVLQEYVADNEKKYDEEAEDDEEYCR